MSQQINLLLPELRPRFDWLALPVVLGAALVGLLFVVAMALFGALQADRATARNAALQGELLALQEQVRSLAGTLGARQGDAQLSAQVATARLATAQRQEILALIRQGERDAPGFSGLLQGFARQTMSGVWLVGSAFAGPAMEIRGRLTGPALLPAYIEKLNGEPAFAGRRFSALDMKGVDPAEEKAAVPGASPTPAAARVEPSYTEFVLRTERPAVEVVR